ncbi:MAG TPA: glycosyltransferase [Polyangiaceae bacterium]|nr:glycosyltransferase [Polyangiaceae bacterium]
MTWLALLLLTLCSAWISAGWIATYRATRRRPPRLERVEPVSVLKPLCGADADLEQNLESLFRQSYPDFEVVFGAVSDDDPGLAVARRVAAHFPEVASHFVVHAGGPGLNPKVQNLRRMLPAARHDLILISDSSLRVPPRWLRELLSVYQHEGRGLVMNLFATADEESLGSALESVQGAGFCMAGVALPTLLGEAAVIGKSTLLSRRELEALGGFERLSDVLAEDFVLGKLFQHAGLKVTIAPTVLANVTRRLSVRDFVARHLRWSMMRWRLEPGAAALEPLVRPLALLPLALHALGAPGLAWCGLLWLVRDLGGHVLLRGQKRLWLPLLLAPLSDLLMLGVWALAPLKRHVSWRGTRLRLGAGTLLYREAPAVNPGVPG